MAIVAPGRARERVLLIGGPGVGKSHAAATIAQRIDGTVHVVDNDNKWDFICDAMELSNVEVYNAWDWASTKESVAKVMANMEKDDFLVVDLLSPTWGMVQSWFSESVFGSDYADHMLSRRIALQEHNEAAKSKKEEKKNLSPFDGFLDWSVINPEYAKFMNMLKRCPGHLICMSEAKAVDNSSDDSGVKGLFGSYGIKPEGQKHTGHRFKTILLMTKNRVGEYRMTTIRDDQRDEYENRDVKNFAINYLMQVAKWKAAS